MLATHRTAEHAPWTNSAIRAIESAARVGGWQCGLDEPLSRHTSMGVGGPCPVMLWPQRSDEVGAIAGWMGSRGLPWRVLGGGTNLLVADNGIDTPVLNMTSLEDAVCLDGGVLRISASVPTARAVRHSISLGLDGLVWSTGLPGTIGGAAAGNAGCWGGDMQQATVDIDVMDSCGAVHRVGPDDLRWDYRSLVLQSVSAPWTILAVGLRVEPADPARLTQRYEELQELKRDRQPVGARNSGCIFRNPPTGEGAGKLIDAAGCKALRVGAAIVSDRHANFIVNLGEARALDIEELIDLIVARVKSHAGVELQPEIRRW